jgi:hypothetical protein
MRTLFEFELYYHFHEFIIIPTIIAYIEPNEKYYGFDIKFLIFTFSVSW